MSFVWERKVIFLSEKDVSFTTKIIISQLMPFAKGDNSVICKDIIGEVITLEKNVITCGSIEEILPL